MNAARYKLTKDRMYNFRWACELYEYNQGHSAFGRTRHFCKRHEDATCLKQVCPKLRFIPNGRMPVAITSRNAEQERIVRE